MSVVFTAHNEQQYMHRTLESLYERTPSEVLWEVIVVDDGSDPPMSTALSSFPEVIILRHDERRGLIKSKYEGGNRASGDMIMFLDAHVKPDWYWIEPLLRHVNINYKRVVVPSIPILDAETWAPNNEIVGYKMMFDWKLSFGWFEDGNDVVPLMSGGLFAITRKWWHESGEYDYDMAMWGAENIEQSIRIWLCGGEIYVARDSRVAHLFRSKFPYVINNTEIYINKVTPREQTHANTSPAAVRTVELWFDEYKHFFYDADPAAQRLIPHVGDLSARRAFQAKMQCKPFREYVKKFRLVFQQKGMLPKESFRVKDKQSDLCMAVDAQKRVIEAPCQESASQRWLLDGDLLRNLASHLCLDAQSATGTHDGMLMIVEPCFGARSDQHWDLDDIDGLLKWHDGYCALPEEGGFLRLRHCGPDTLGNIFVRENIKVKRAREEKQGITRRQVTEGMGRRE
eukprot:3319448-Amphidinium_carterae.2